jgi:hypothetical protein
VGPGKDAERRSGVPEMGELDEAGDDGDEPVLANGAQHQIFRHLVEEEHGGNDHPDPEVFIFQATLPKCQISNPKSQIISKFKLSN